MLFWNGYFLDIPPNADKIILAIADAKREDVTYEHAYNWLIENTTCNPLTLLFHLFVVFTFMLISFLRRDPFEDILNRILYTLPHADMMESLLFRANLHRKE